MNKNKNKNEESEVVEQKETQLQHHLGEIMLFPLDVQDKIIEEISLLPLCTKEAVEEILNNYSKEQTENKLKASLK